MKPIFSFDITENRENDNMNGHEFIIKTNSEQKVSELESKEEQFQKTVQESELPSWVRAVRYASGLFALITLTSSMPVCLDIGLRKMLMNAPFLLLSALLCAIVWIVLTALAAKTSRRILEQQNADAQIEQIERNAQSLYDEMGVPRDALYVDILLFRYKVKNGVIRPSTIGIQWTPFLNPAMRIFLGDGCLHLASVDRLYAFPLCDIKAIRTVHKRLAVLSWNKDEGPTEGRFKPYKLAVNDFGMIFFKPYHILEIERDGETYGVYFPSYEREVFEGLTGLCAEP